MRVMIVDNDEAWTRSLTILLTDCGYEVYPFTNPLKACEFVRQIAQTGFLGKREVPDAVVLDYVMPEMSGLQVLRRIAGDLRPNCRVVFVTGHGELLRHAKLAQMGVAAWLEKPMALEDLVKALEDRAA